MNLIKLLDCYPKPSLNNLFFCFRTQEDLYEITLYVYLCPKDHWRRYGVPSSGFFEEAGDLLYSLMKRFDLVGLDKVSLEYAGHLGMQELGEALEEEGLQYNHAFESYVRQFY